MKADAVRQRGPGRAIREQVEEWHIQRFPGPNAEAEARDFRNLVWNFVVSALEQMEAPEPEPQQPTVSGGMK